MNNLSELLEEQLKDLYSAENQLLKALPRMAKAASNEELKAAFEQHTEETRGHIERLDQVAEQLGVKPKGKVCAAMKGLIEEGKEVLEEDGHELILDAALIAAAQRIEHYEIAAYGTVKAIAAVLGHDELVEIFDETLKEEEATDEKLTTVAEEGIYADAPRDENSGEEEEEEEEEPAPKPSKAANRGGKKVAKKSTKSRGR